MRRSVSVAHRLSSRGATASRDPGRSAYSPVVVNVMPPMLCTKTVILFVPGPSCQVPATTPCASVIDDWSVAWPPPSQTTTGPAWQPEIGLPLASTARTSKEMLDPASPVCGPAIETVPLEAMTTSLKVSVEPTVTGAIATIASVPTPPSVAVTDALPSASVNTEVWLTEAPPVPLHETANPGTGAPDEDVTRTVRGTGSVDSAGPNCESPKLFVISNAVGWTEQTFATQTVPPTHAPQSMVPPHPSGTGPQDAPVAAQVVGVHTFPSAPLQTKTVPFAAVS